MACCVKLRVENFSWSAAGFEVSVAFCKIIAGVVVEGYEHHAGDYSYDHQNSHDDESLESVASLVIPLIIADAGGGHGEHCEGADFATLITNYITSADRLL